MLQVRLAGLIALACLAAGPTAAPQAAGAITGRVIGGLADVTVLAHRPTEGPLKKSLTDADGNYHIDGLDAGTYTVEFDHPVYDVVRRHGVTVAAGSTTADVSARLQLSPMCECVEQPAIVDPGIVTGTVTDDTKRPVPHARLEIRGGGTRTEDAYAGLDGEFSLKLPAGTTWTLTAGDVFFSSVTQTIQVSRRNNPIAMRLSPRWGVEFEGLEILKRGCRCGGDLFTHSLR